tara:strand:+ start:179 stop:712 length:534 start_codon:yes stop_codon:yes gene_type:complete
MKKFKSYYILLAIPLLFLVSSCGSSKTPEELVSETLSAPTVSFDKDKTASCFSTKSQCTDLEKDLIKDELYGNYIIVRNVAVKDIEADGDNKYSVEFCGKQNYLPVHCMTYSQKGQMVMNGGYTQCEYRTKLIVTDSQKSLLSQLKKGSTWNVKGKVSTIMSVGQCGLSLRNAVLVK